jgi:hypothetical protein
MRRTLVLLVALASASPLLRAQPAPKPAPAPAAASSAAKKDLIAKIVKAQQGGIDQMARQMVEQPALMMLQSAGPVVQNRVPADQRETVARELQNDVRKYVDETLPIVRQKAQAIAPATIGPLLDKSLSEAELKEIVAILESSAWRKFQGLMPELQKALVEKLVAETKGQVEPKVKALEQSMRRRLDAGVAASAPPPASAPAAGK